MGWSSKDKCSKSVELERDSIGIFSSDATIEPCDNNKSVQIRDHQDDIEGSVLFLPLIRYGNWGKEIRFGKDCWIQGSIDKYFRPSTIFYLYFALLKDTNDTESFASDVYEFASMIKYLCVDRGVIVDESKIEYHDFSNVDDINELIKKERMSILVIIGANNKIIQHCKIAEVLTNTQIECVPVETILKEDYTEPVQFTLNKINLKTGGINHGLGTTLEQKETIYERLSSMPGNKIDNFTDFHLSFFTKTVVIGYDFYPKKTNSCITTTAGSEVKLPELTSVGYSWTTLGDAHVTGGGYFYSKSSAAISKDLLRDSIGKALDSYKKTSPYKYPQRLIIFYKEKIGGSTEQVTEKRVKTIEAVVETVCNDKNIPSIGLLLLSVQHPTGLVLSNDSERPQAGFVHKKSNNEFWMYPSYKKLSASGRTLDNSELTKVSIRKRKEFSDSFGSIQQAVLNLCYSNEYIDSGDAMPAPITCATRFAERGMLIYNNQIPEKYEELSQDMNNYESKATMEFEFKLKTGYID